MTKQTLIFLLGLAAMALCATASAQIKSPEDRAEKLMKARAFLDNSVRPIEAEQLAHAVDPFSLDLGRALVATDVVKPMHSDAEVLAILSRQVNPTGTLTFGGDNYLVLRETKLKEGGELAVMYNGKEYRLKVTDITSVSYVLTYGNSELQLKIK